VGRGVVDLDDVTKKAQEFLSDPKVKDALKSEQAEGISDKLLDGVADAANKVTGGKFEGQIDDARAAADKEIGDK
jgi:MT0933-like antitoxin protein